MADEKYTFTQARVRLEEIVAQVRKKDVSLEKSIELLEEGVRLANQCTELSDHTEWQRVIEEQETVGSDDGQDSDDSTTESNDAPPNTDDAPELDDDRDGVAAQPFNDAAGE